MGKCSSTDGGPDKLKRIEAIKKLINGAAQKKEDFTHNVGQLKGALASEEVSVTDSKVAVQTITEGILDAAKPDQQRFWYLLVLRHILDVHQDKLSDIAAKKLGNTFKAIAMHRSDERIMSRGRDCLKNISGSLGRSTLMQIRNGQSDSFTYCWSV